MYRPCTLWSGWLVQLVHFDVGPQLQRKSEFGPCFHNGRGIHLPKTHHYHYGSDRSQHSLAPTAIIQIAIFLKQFHLPQVRLNYQPKLNQMRHHYKWYLHENDSVKACAHIQFEVFQVCVQRIDQWRQNLLLHNCCELECPTFPVHS